MAPKYRLLILFAISLIVTYFVYWPILRIAKEKGIVDNPNARKLQRIPVPVLGGLAVFCGIVVGLCFFKTMLSYTSLFAVVTVMVVMLYVGTIDDILNLSPMLRFGIELIAAALLIFGTHFTISNFQGLWGIRHLSLYIAIPFTVLASVGIFNAVNMIDGVDGLVSGFCIVACTMFGLIFFLSYDYSFAALAVVTVGALIPFFLHNVFGNETKMFIGDGGSMMLGTILAAMVAALCRSRTDYTMFIDHQFGLIAFSMSVVAIPVFDTLRVMIYRIMHRQSPFHPDKNHLHHLFIELGFSHFVTTMWEIILEVFVVAVWAVTWYLNASVSVQFYAVFAASMLATFGVAGYLKYHISKKTRMYSILREYGRLTDFSDKSIWKKIQRFIDNGPFSREGK